MTPNVNIQLPETHIAQIKNYYRNRLEEIEKEVTEIKSILLHLDKPAMSISHAIAKPAPALDFGYNRKWSFSKKIKYIIRANGKPLTTREIVETLINQYEPEAKQYRGKIVGTISSILSTGSKDGGSFIKQKDENDQNIFSLKN